MSETKARSTDQVGKLLKARATHYNHGEGWTYSRGVEGLEHIRFRSDYTGYDHWTRRLARALSPKDLLGIDRLSRMLGRETGLKSRLLSASAHFRVNIRKESNLPDGGLPGVLTFAEENGEYIEMVGPTIGAKIADFLIAEPDHPHAQAISEEIERILELSRQRLAQQRAGRGAQ